MDHEGDEDKPGFATMTRREVVKVGVVAGVSFALTESCTAETKEAIGADRRVRAGADPEIVLDINDRPTRVRIDPRETLLDVLRERLQLTGTKKGCDHGQCGACTVIVDERRVNSCLTLAIMAQGKKITTIEGLAEGDRLHPMQAAFLDEDALHRAGERRRPDIEVIMIDEDDPHVNDVGAKGIGEIGIVGAGAAIANAVHHATGRRVRDLPITIEKLLG